MRRPLLASLAVLASAAGVAAPATASADWRPYECNRFVHCTVYGPDGQPITSYDEIRERVDELPPQR